MTSVPCYNDRIDLVLCYSPSFSRGSFSFWVDGVFRKSLFPLSGEEVFGIRGIRVVSNKYSINCMERVQFPRESHFLLFPLFPLFSLRFPFSSFFYFFLFLLSFFSFLFSRRLAAPIHRLVKYDNGADTHHRNSTTHLFIIIKNVRTRTSYYCTSTSPRRLLATI